VVIKPIISRVAGESEAKTAISRDELEWWRLNCADLTKIAVEQDDGK